MRASTQSQAGAEQGGFIVGVGWVWEGELYSLLVGLLSLWGVAPGKF